MKSEVLWKPIYKHKIHIHTQLTICMSRQNEINAKDHFIKKECLHAIQFSANVNNSKTKQHTK